MSIEQALVHARGIYDVSCVGCCWHVVLDDNNVDDDFIASCTRRAESGGDPYDCETPEHCKALGPLLKAMTDEEQCEFFDRFNEWPPGTAASMFLEDEPT